MYVGVNSIKNSKLGLMSKFMLKILLDRIAVKKINAIARSLGFQ